MITANNDRKSFVCRRRELDKPMHSVWHEVDRRGGFIIYAGVRGTGIRTYAGRATSSATLEYNMRKAKTKFGLSID